MTFRTLALAYLASTVVASPAFAQSDADQEACTPDVFRLCQAYIPDEGPIVTCLTANGPQLSPACHKVIFPAPVVSRGHRRHYRTAQ